MGTESREADKGDASAEAKDYVKIELEPDEVNFLSTMSNIFEGDPIHISKIVVKIIRKEIAFIKKELKDGNYEFFSDYLEGSKVEKILLGIMND